jgi:hypothetical protein
MIIRGAAMAVVRLMLFSEIATVISLLNSPYADVLFVDFPDRELKPSAPQSCDCVHHGRSTICRPQE